MKTKTSSANIEFSVTRAFEIRVIIPLMGEELIGPLKRQ